MQSLAHSQTHSLPRHPPSRPSLASYGKLPAYLPPSLLPSLTPSPSILASRHRWCVSWWVRLYDVLAGMLHDCELPLQPSGRSESQIGTVTAGSGVARAAIGACRRWGVGTRFSVWPYALFFSAAAAGFQRGPSRHRPAQSQGYLTSRKSCNERVRLLGLASRCLDDAIIVFPLLRTRNHS